MSRLGWIGDDAIAGEMLRIDTPTWEPLLELAPDHIEDFMWMFDVELEAEPDCMLASTGGRGATST
jgi:hypothetical protein